MNTPFLLSGLLLTTSMACLAPRQKAEFETNLQRWVGRPIQEFIAVNGRPDQPTERPEGGKIYVFHTRMRTEVTTTTYRTYTNTSTGERLEPPGDMRNPGDRVAITTQSATGVNRLSCRLTLETDAQGTILKTRYEGNDCW